jgi:hypothetical protein
LLLICVLDLSAISQSDRRSSYAWAIVCGLSGVPSCILAPGFLLRAALSRSRPHLIIGLILAGCAIIELSVFFTHQIDTNRSFPRDSQLLLLPTLLQTILVPLFGVAAVGYLGSHIRADLPALGLWAIGGGAIALALVATVCATAWRGDRSRHAVIITLLWLWFTASVINTFGSFGDPVDLIGSWPGGRYYLLGAVAFALLLALCTDVANRTAACAAIAALWVIVAASAVSDFGGRWHSFISAGGPSWRHEVERCGTQRPCQVRIWPAGWTFNLLLR